MKNNTLEFCNEFTKRYKEYAGLSKQEKELRLREFELRKMLCPPKEGDFLCGRMDYYPIGLYHIIYGDGVSNGIDQFGYCCDDGILMSKCSDNASKEQAAELCEFWKNEKTESKCRADFTDKMKQFAPSDDWQHERAVIHPLYRLAEIQSDYRRLVDVGFCGIRQEVEEYSCVDPDGGFASAVKLFEFALDYYTDALETGTVKNERMLAALRKIKVAPPDDFMSAMELMWLWSVVLGSPDFIRLDDILAPFYEKGIADGTLDDETVVNCFESLYKLIEELYHRDSRIVFGGKGRRRVQSADKLCILLMEAGIRTRLPYPQLSLRLWSGTGKEVWDKALDCFENGLSFPVLYNDDVCIPSVNKAFGVPYEWAENYSFLGCGEFMLSHRSVGTPNAIINLPLMLETVLCHGKTLRGDVLGADFGGTEDYDTFDKLLSAYKKELDFFAELCAGIQKSIYDTVSKDVCFYFESLLLSGCVQSGKPVLDGGIPHLGGTVETYGNTTLSDSLYAIKRIVYERKLITLKELVEALKSNFSGYGELLREIKRVPKYGNGEIGPDNMASMLHDILCDSMARAGKRNGLDSFLVVMINNSANNQLGKYVSASSDGRLDADLLSNANGPTPGCDTNGLTALVRSLTTLSTDNCAGITQNFKFSHEMLTSKRKVLLGALKTFFALGGEMCNVSTVDPGELEDAMEHPERHGDLIVRVGGYSEFFVKLDRDVQLDMLRRSTY